MSEIYILRIDKNNENIQLYLSDQYTSINNIDINSATAIEYSLIAALIRVEGISPLGALKPLTKNYRELEEAAKQKALEASEILRLNVFTNLSENKKNNIFWRKYEEIHAFINKLNTDIVSSEILNYNVNLYNNLDKIIEMSAFASVVSENVSKLKNEIEVELKKIEKENNNVKLNSMSNTLLNKNNILALSITNLLLLLQSFMIIWDDFFTNLNELFDIFRNQGSGFNAVLSDFIETKNALERNLILMRTKIEELITILTEVITESLSIASNILSNNNYSTNEINYFRNIKQLVKIIEDSIGNQKTSGVLSATEVFMNAMAQINNGQSIKQSTNKENTHNKIKNAALHMIENLNNYQDNLEYKKLMLEFSFLMLAFYDRSENEKEIPIFKNINDLKNFKGRHTIKFDFDSLRNGTHYYKIIMNDGIENILYSRTGKMFYLRKCKKTMIINKKKIINITKLSKKKCLKRIILNKK